MVEVTGNGYQGIIIRWERFCGSGSIVGNFSDVVVWVSSCYNHAHEFTSNRIGNVVMI
jgi:preprotein translocase subunit SecF